MARNLIGWGRSGVSLRTGALGLAFDPAHALNGHFYVNYT